MIGIRAIEKIERVRAVADQFGLKFERSRNGYSEFDGIALVPKDQDSLPIYTRDAELFSGTLDEVEDWLNGVMWAKSYYQMLGLVDDKKIQRKEQDERNRRLINLLKQEKKSK